jgi:hypothetical protein
MGGGEPFDQSHTGQGGKEASRGAAFSAKGAWGAGGRLRARGDGVAAPIVRLGRSLYRSVGQRAPENVTDRKALAKAIASLGSGDVLVVTSWIGDTVYSRFSKHAGCCAKAGAGFRSLADVCLGRYHDTPLAADAHGAERIGGIGEGIDPIADGVREAARARGVRFGRKLKLTLHQQQEAILDKQPAKAWQRLAEAIT